MESLKLYIPITTPPSSGMDTISCTIGSLPSEGVKVIDTVPGRSTLKLVARYWSPKAWRPMTIGLVHPGTRRGTFDITIGSAENGSAQDVSDRPVGRQPHPLQVELLDARLVGGDRGALDANAVPLDGI